MTDLKETPEGALELQGAPQPRTENGLLPCNAKKILLVDDESNIRTLVKTMLKHVYPHCEVDEAGNGAEAVEAFRTGHHGVLLMDMRMPVMSGEDAFRAIKGICAGEHRQMPAVLFCTGYDPNDALRDTVEADTRHGFLKKPIRFAALTEALGKRLPSA